MICKFYLQQHWQVLHKYTMPISGIQRPIFTSEVAWKHLKPSNESCLLDNKFSWVFFVYFFQEQFESSMTMTPTVITLHYAQYYSNFASS